MVLDLDLDLGLGFALDPVGRVSSNCSRDRKSSGLWDSLEYFLCLPYLKQYSDGLERWNVMSGQPCWIWLKEMINGLHFEDKEIMT